ncbi:MAG TPA: glycosyltransferase [Clostridia bacterium]|nr:glycosyltransferase [Clostridia bacterium]
MKLSIIIPVYNSEKTIKVLINELIEFIDKKIEYEIVLVDDFSSDSSYEVLERIAEYNRDIKIIKLDKNYGQQNALFAGLNFVTGDLVLTMDDDLQHDIKYLDAMIEELNKGYDVVYGIDYEKNVLNYKTFGAKIRDLFFRLSFPKVEKNLVSSFRIFRSKLIPDILQNKFRFIYLSGVLLRLSNRITYIKVRNRNSKNQSNYNFVKLVKLFLKLSFYYSKLVPDKVKPKGEQYKIEKTININSH